MKTILIIPCFNEAMFIESVIKESQKYVDDILVCDDFSTDDTVEIVHKNNAIVCWNTGDKGAGSNTATGIKYALMDNPDILITMDGDGQHAPFDIPNMIKPIIEDKADLVIGNRFINNVMKIGVNIPLYREFGNNIINYFYNLYSSNRIQDTQCGFRAFKREVAEKCIITEIGFGFSTEFLIKAHKYGFRIAEVPIACVYNKDFNQNSSQNPLLHGLEVLWATWKWRIKVG